MNKSTLKNCRNQSTFIHVIAIVVVPVHFIRVITKSAITSLFKEHL